MNDLPIGVMGNTTIDAPAEQKPSTSVDKLCACGATFTEQQSSGDTCYKCKVSSMSFAFRGATGFGRKAFHDSTIREALSESNRNIKAAGGNPKDFEHSGKRWV